ncbi:hypothetical protein CaCOL14_003333 [Colletotrichum acutatum]
MLFSVSINSSLSHFCTVGHRRLADKDSVILCVAPTSSQQGSLAIQFHGSSISANITFAKMASNIQQRVEKNCKIFWGDHDYEIDYETDDNMVFQYFVLRDYGSLFGPPLTMTFFCDSEEAAYRELDRMLVIRAAQVGRGTPTTKEERP